MKNLRIAFKIGLALAILLAVNIGAMAALTYGTFSVNRQSVEIAENWLPSVRVLGEIDTQTADFRIAQLQHVGTTDAKVMAAAESAMNDLELAIAQNADHYKKLISSEIERQIWTRFENAWTAYRESHKVFLAMSRANQNDKANAMLYGEMLKNFHTASAVLHEDVALNNQGSKEAEKEAARIYTVAKWVGSAAMAASILLGIAVVFALQKSIAQPILQMKSYMAVLQSGDYDQDLPLMGRGDEIGQMAGSIAVFRDGLIENRAMTAAQLKEAQRKLDQQERVVNLVRDFDKAASAAVNAVATAATELSQAATEISTVARNTNEAAKGAVVASVQTAGNVQAVAASVEQMSASTGEISRQVAKSAEIAREAAQEAEIARETSSEMLEATLSIGQVASMIDGIAGQINLLALNATIEAVRAGEPGRGFSVVAGEIKNLAAQTTEATEKINNQLARVQNMASKVAETLAKLAASVEEVDTVSSSISAAVRQQAAATVDISGNMNVAATGVERINHNITDIQGSTESTSSATQQVLSASLTLSRQAEDLDSDVRSFLDAIKAA